MITTDRNLINHEMNKTSFVLGFNVPNLNNDDYKALDNEPQASLVKIAEERARKLYGAKYARVEYKNLAYAIQYSLKDMINEGDKIIALDEKWGGYSEFNSLPYKTIRFDLGSDFKLDYEKIAELLKTEQPKVLFIGARFSQYVENYRVISQICKENGVLLFSIINPSAALTATGIIQNPTFWSDIVIVSMEGNLRGKEGAFILTNDKDTYAKLLTRNADYEFLIYNATVLKEAASPKFSIYGRKCFTNARALADTFVRLRIKTHLPETNIVILDVSDSEKCLNLLRLKGYDATQYGETRIVFDSSYLTTLGFKLNDFQEFARRIAEIIR